MTRLREGGADKAGRPQNPLKFSSFDGLASLQDEWDELYRDSCCVSHYLTFEFVQLWYSCFASPEQIRIYQIVDAHGVTIGVLPLVMKSSQGLRILSSLTNFHCMHFGPLVRIGYEAVFQTLLLSELYRGWPDWDLLKLEYCNDFDRIPALFPPDILDAKRHRWRCFSESNYTVRLDRSFKDYMSGLSAKVRKNYNNMKSRYDRNAAWSIEIYQGSDALAQWDTFLELESSGWKGDGGSSIKNISDNHRRFYSRLLPLLAKSGSLRVSLLWYKGEPIAGAYMYREGRILHMFKAGYDSAYHSKSPSNILFMETVRILSEFPDGLEILSMFPGDFGYKHKIMQQEHRCYTTLLYRRTVRGSSVHRYHQIKAQVNEILRWAKQ